MGQPAGGIVLGSEADIAAQRMAGQMAAAAAALEGGASTPEAGAEVVGAGYAEAQKQQEERAQGGTPISGEQSEAIKKETKEAAKKNLEEYKRKAEEAKKAADAAKAAEANRRRLIDITSDNNKACFKEYGNNFFILSDDVNNACNGVMLELPAISMSTKWDASPAAAMSEALLKYINKPEFEFLATNGQGESKYKVLRRTGNLTSKVYESTEPISFDIKFRIYSGQPTGDMKLSNVTQWKNFLDKAVIKDLETKNIVNDVITNLGAVADASADQSLDIIGDIKSALKSATAEGKKENIWTREQFDDGKPNYVNEYYTEVIYTNEITNETVTVDVWGCEEKLLKEIEDHNNKIKQNTANRSTLAKAQLANISGKISNNAARVTNSASKFGAQLYKLRIYPFIFNEPLIIYISSWTVTPSKEWNDNLSCYYYYDFTLSCNMDQVPSSSTWLSILR